MKKKIFLSILLPIICQNQLACSSEKMFANSLLSCLITFGISTVLCDSFTPWNNTNLGFAFSTTMGLITLIGAKNAGDFTIQLQDLPYQFNPSEIYQNIERFLLNTSNPNDDFFQKTNQLLTSFFITFLYSDEEMVKMIKAIKKTNPKNWHDFFVKLLQSTLQDEEFSEKKINWIMTVMDTEEKINYKQEVQTWRVIFINELFLNYKKNKDDIESLINGTPSEIYSHLLNFITTSFLHKEDPFYPLIIFIESVFKYCTTYFPINSQNIAILQDLTPTIIPKIANTSNGQFAINEFLKLFQTELKKHARDPLIQQKKKKMAKERIKNFLSANND